MTRKERDNVITRQKRLGNFRLAHNDKIIKGMMSHVVQLETFLIVDTLKCYVVITLDVLKWYLRFLPLSSRVNWLLNRQWKFSRRFYLLVIVVIAAKHEYNIPPLYYRINIFDPLEGSSSLIDIAMKSSSRFFKPSIQGPEKAITVGRLK